MGSGSLAEVGSIGSLHDYTYLLQVWTWLARTSTPFSLACHIAYQAPNQVVADSAARGQNHSRCKDTLLRR